MKVVFIAKRNWLRALILIAIFGLLGAGAVLLPRNGNAGTGVMASQPYRSGDAESPYISLAVNVDWGEEYIPGLLKVLAENGVSASFFLTGRWCDNNPDLAAEIAAFGHELGNHGYSHKSPNASSCEEIIGEIKRTEEAIEKATGIVTRLYAPPSGEAEPHVLVAAAETGYDTVLWSVDTIDWQKPDAATIIQRVKKQIHGGAIILSHPTASTVEACHYLIKDLKEEGYAFVTVSVNLGL